MPEDDITLIEGEDAPPDLELNPTENDTEHDDPDMPDPKDLPKESFEADESDTKGKEEGV